MGISWTGTGSWRVSDKAGLTMEAWGDQGCPRGKAAWEGSPSGKAEARNEAEFDDTEAA